MINCDKCNKDFNMDVKIKKYDGGIEKVHFYCPHCNQEYISYFTNPDIRKKQKKISFMKDRDKIKKMKSEILKDMQSLAGKMLGTQ